MPAEVIEGPRRFDGLRVGTFQRTDNVTMKTCQLIDTRPRVDSNPKRPAAVIALRNNRGEPSERFLIF